MTRFLTKLSGVVADIRSDDTAILAVSAFLSGIMTAFMFLASLSTFGPAAVLVLVFLVPLLVLTQRLGSSIWKHFFKK